MKKPYFAFSLAILLLLLWTPRSASAKSDTAKITIAGGRLTNTIEVTDPQVLALSNIWAGQFLDTSRNPESDAPQGLRPYEVSFYARLEENDVRKMYVAYYYPNFSSKQGFIYLPGIHEITNMGTIIRKGRDGKWNYVSHAWEALIKPVIARAKAGSNSASALEAAAQKSQGSSKASQVTVDGWTKPQPGWLYILDPRSESDHPGSRIWLLDPEIGKVMGSVRAGYEPDFTLSPDGSHLYVASGERESGELAVIDTTSGTITHIPFPNRILYRPWYVGLPPYSSMAVSSDGRALRILMHHIFPPNEFEYQLWTFDTKDGRFLPATVHIGSCEYGDFAASSTARQFDYLCPATNTLRSIQLDSDYQEASNTFVKLPWPKECGASEGFLSSDGNKLALVRSDGAIYEMNTTTHSFNPTPVGGNCHQSLVFPHPLPGWPDDTKGYLGYGSEAPNGMSLSAEVRIFDTATWQQLRSFRTSVPFWSAVASKDGKFIYALSPEQHSVLLIDAASFKEKHPISVGKTPAVALIAR